MQRLFSRRLFRRLFFIGFALFLLIQLIPVWLWQTNPPVRAEPAWPNQETRALAVRACFECHSNETRWPLYSRIAPMSWLVTSDVLRGRDELNFSEWDDDEAEDQREDAADEAEDQREDAEDEAEDRRDDAEDRSGPGGGDGDEGRSGGDVDVAQSGSGNDGDDLTEVIRDGEMPPGNYLLLHPEARLTAAELQQLIGGLETLDR